MVQKKWLSIIIPTLNEVTHLRKLLPYLCKHSTDQKDIQYIIVDASGEDTSDLKSLCSEHETLLITSPVKSRAVQLHLGVEYATADTLYFLHADTLPPVTYVQDIERLLDDEYQAGCFAYQFDTKNPLLKVNAWFTQFRTIFTGGGDQGLIITKKLYSELGGYNQDAKIMEDFEIYDRIIDSGIDFHIMKSLKTVSARKYLNNSYIKVNIVNWILLRKFRQGKPTSELKAIYQRWIK